MPIATNAPDARYQVSIHKRSWSLQYVAIARPDSLGKGKTWNGPTITFEEYVREQHHRECQRQSKRPYIKRDPDAVVANVGASKIHACKRRM